MELVELKSRLAEESEDGTKSGLKDAELEEARNATGMRKRSALPRPLGSRDL